jgi:hypothetical protein
VQLPSLQINSSIRIPAIPVSFAPASAVFRAFVTAIAIIAVPGVIREFPLRRVVLVVIAGLIRALHEFGRVVERFAELVFAERALAPQTTALGHNQTTANCLQTVAWACGSHVGPKEWESRRADAR